MFQNILTVALSFCLIWLSLSSQPLMLEAKEDFIDKVDKTNLAVFFYGSSETQQYQEYEGILPSGRELFAGLEFYFIPSGTIKLSKKTETLFIYRNIPGNEWITYQGPMQTSMMSEWVRHNCFDTLRDITGDDIDDMFVNKKKGFVMLEFGQFELLATKILLSDFCKERQLLCGKCNMDNEVLSIVVQLMRADDEYGVPKLAFWDPNTQKFQLYTKVPLHQIKYNDLVEIVDGREGLVKAETLTLVQNVDSEQQQMEKEEL